jgi:hypothetical protein
VRRVPLAESLLVVALLAVTALFATVGIDLRRRGFTGSEITIVIALPVALDIVLCRGVIAVLRRRRQ